MSSTSSDRQKRKKNQNAANRHASLRGHDLSSSSSPLAGSSLLVQQQSAHDALSSSPVLQDVITFPLATNCQQYEKTIPTHQTFQKLLNAYKIVKSGNKKHLKKDKKDNFALGKLMPGTEIQMDSRGGRGLFAVRDLHKGDMIYDAKAATFVDFKTEESYLRFLVQLQPKLQCDVLLWSYTSDDSIVITAIDENCCVNHGGKHDMNIGYTFSGYYAKRKIKMGEEILDNYNNYMVYNSVDWFERIRSNAWGGGVVGTKGSTDKNDGAANLYLQQGTTSQALETKITSPMTVAENDEVSFGNMENPFDTFPSWIFLGSLVLIFLLLLLPKRGRFFLKVTTRQPEKGR